MDPDFCLIIWKETFYTFWLFLFDASRTSNMETGTGAASWTIITYTDVRKSSSYSGAMDVGTGVFTAPLAGTYQFIIQAYKVSPFLLLTNNLTIFYLLTHCRIRNWRYASIVRLRDFVPNKFRYVCTLKLLQNKKSQKFEMPTKNNVFFVSC